MLSFRNLRTTEDVTHWLAGLEERWPERQTVIQHIIDQVRVLSLPLENLVELCPGAGSLAERLLTEFPHMIYTGLDSSALLLAVARERLDAFGTQAALIQTDLNQDGWLDQIPEKVQAVVSLQSLHDLGGETEVARMYGLAHEILVSGGLFLNADLIVATAQEQAQHPGRCTVARHLELLRAQGFDQVACSLEVGGFGCYVGVK